MSNGFAVLPLSKSLGGAPILLNATGSPGNQIHANPSDSGGNDVVRNVLIGNPNPNQITLIARTQGPGIDTPSAVRIDVPPTAEGTEVRLFYTPFLVAPGFSYFLEAQLQAGNQPPYVYGYVERHVTGGFSGYGGIYTSTAVAILNLTAGNWVKLPSQAGAVAVPKNVVQNVAQGALQVAVPGVWAASAHATLTFTKQNVDRILYMRIWDDTAGVELSDSPWPMYVEQQATGGSVTLPAGPVDVAQALVNHDVVLEIGGAAQDFNGLQLEKSGLSFYLLDPAL